MANYPWLRLKQLPKDEYLLMQTLVKEYALADASEVFRVALRLMDEVARFDPPHGEAWILRLIAECKPALLP